jgi:putative phosphoribosyl transferase
MSGDAVVVGIPRGGVPVAAMVALELGAPLDIVVVRKVGLPAQPEIAMGAIGEGDTRVVNDEIVRAARIDPEVFDRVEAVERAELQRRAAVYRQGRVPPSLAGRTVIVVDDGLATGATSRVALEVVRNLGATRVILAVPVAPAATLRELSRYADEIVCVHRPSEFHAVGCFYDDFEPTTDAEVIGALALHHQPRRMPAPLDLRTSAAAGSRVATTL